MAGLDLRRLALVRCILKDGGGCSVGTGYFVTANLMLTAGHVVPVRSLAQIDVRTDADDTWRTADVVPAWRDEGLDAVLIHVRDGLGEVDDIRWTQAAFPSNVAWESAAYPIASHAVVGDRVVWKSAGLKGTLYAAGGGGQGPKELDLGVDHAPGAEDWSAASGAPVFVGDELAGFIRLAPTAFKGGRLAGVPATALRHQPGLLVALAKPWLTPAVLPGQPWVLVVLSEAENTGLAEFVDAALDNDHKAIDAVVRDPPMHRESVKVSITDALQSPERWLQFVKALCQAPVAVFDATDFQPAVMLALGVRAVVRRGVTITSTAKELSPTHLSKLPFNVQETKLVHHGSGYPPSDDRYPSKMIATAIKKGWQELHTLPRYLDLPAYDGVRCPYPWKYTDEVSAVERILVLCSFDSGYHNWQKLVDAVTKHWKRIPARMLDVASPRLVGQALYEGIRWSRTCLVDWTGWRANVFFELGVRLACCEFDPVCIADDSTVAAPGSGTLDQHQLMRALWQPTVYPASQGDKELREAFKLHDAMGGGDAPEMPQAALPRGATYATCCDAFAWSQESITIEPHDVLRRSVQEPFGNDPQADGRSPVLFSSNSGFKAELGRSVRERWIAAWYYLEHRYPKSRWRKDRGHRAAVKRLANQVLLSGPSMDDPDPLMQSLRKHLVAVIDRLEDMDDLNDASPGKPVP